MSVWSFSSNMKTFCSFQEMSTTPLDFHYRWVSTSSENHQPALWFPSLRHIKTSLGDFTWNTGTALLCRVSLSGRKRINCIFSYGFLFSLIDFVLNTLLISCRWCLSLSTFPVTTCIADLTFFRVKKGTQRVRVRVPVVWQRGAPPPSFRRQQL